MLVETLSAAFVTRVRGVRLASTWANLLRAVPAEGLRAKDLPAVTALSRRAMKSVLGAGERMGLVSVDADIVRLTDAGRAVRPATTLEVGCAHLADLVSRFELEHPHHLTPYGTADPTMTGGPGVDWKPVPRGPGGDTAALPVASLLSQALTAFGIEYESERRGSIMWSANVLRGIGDAGVPLAALPQAGTHGAPNLQRLRMASIGEDKMVRLTPIGRAMRDSFEPLSREIEGRWRGRYGSGLIDQVIEALGAPEEGLPPFPEIVWTGAEFAVSG